MVKSAAEPDEALVLVIASYPNVLAIPASMTQLLGACEVWSRTYVDKEYVVAPSNNTPELVLVPARRVTAARMLTYTEAEQAGKDTII